MWVLDDSVSGLFIIIIYLNKYKSNNKGVNMLKIKSDEVIKP